MGSKVTKEQLETLKYQANEHEVIKADGFNTAEEYVLHLMHISDYEVAASLAQQKSVLDLGCNSGYGTNIISKVCKHVTGVDVSPSAIAAATERYESRNTKFAIVDGHKLPFPSQAFDLVTSFQVIEHLADYEVYFSEIKRVLQPDGILLITTPNASIRVHPGQKPWNPFHVREFTSNELGELASRYFPFTRVFGQFAVEKTYAIEYNRCINARGSIPMQHSFIKKVFHTLPQPLINILQSIRTGLKVSKMKEQRNDFFNMHFVQDFYYKNLDLDNSLSLVVCCSREESVLGDAATVFLKHL